MRVAFWEFLLSTADLHACREPHLLGHYFLLTHLCNVLRQSESESWTLSYKVGAFTKASAEAFAKVPTRAAGLGADCECLTMDLLLHGRPGCRMGLQHRAKNHYYVTIRKPTKSKILAIGWPWAICLLIGDPSTYCSGYLCFNEVACKLKINEINVKRKYTMGIFWAYFLKFFGCQFLVVC